MTITRPLFCKICGAALPAQVMRCPGCGNAVPVSPSHSAAPSPGLSASASDATQQPGPGFLLAGRYLLLEKIGEGGFGVVYKARDRRRPGKLVAVKQINMAALNAQEKIEATDSFYREIRLLSPLRHQSLPRIYDHFTDPEHWYVVMDYIKGQTLEDLLKRVPGGRLSLTRVADIGLALCDVLTCLHTQRPPIIFRDVKPANIMLNPWGRLYLIDFGIARHYQAGRRKDTMPLGSPGYAAPEQYGRAQSSPQSDIYGLGATLQTLLTGQEPQEIRLSGLPADCVLPQDVQALIERMMDYDASKRPPIKEIERTLKPYCVPWSWRGRSYTLRVLWSLCGGIFSLFFSFFGGFRQIFFLNPPWLFAFFLSWLAVIMLIYSFFMQARAREFSLSLPSLCTLRTLRTLLHTGWRSFTVSLPYAGMLLYLMQLVYTVQNLLFWLRPIDIPAVGVSLVGLVAILGLFVYELYRLLSWLRVQRTFQRQAQQVQRAQAPLLQQQVQRHP